MDISSILDCIGSSIHEQRVQEILEKYELAEVKESNNSPGLQSLFSKEPNQFYGPAEFKNKELGIYINFSPKKSFLSEYKYLKFEKYPEDEHELILAEVTIEPKDNSLNLPFELRYLMSGESIRELLGAPLEKSQLFGEIKWGYRINTYKILLSLNYDYQLLWLRAWSVDLHTYWAEERETNLAEYDPKIKGIPANEIIELRKLNPSDRWKEYNDEWFEELDDGERDESALAFRKKALDFFDLLNALFEEYLKMISKYGKEQNAKMLYSTLKTTIEKFNEWNNIHKYIETMEREGICEFLEIILKVTGFEIHEDEEISLIWREW